eukprot:365535-Chlamydomonas_euryale.AAC.96
MEAADFRCIHRSAGKEDALLTRRAHSDRRPLLSQYVRFQADDPPAQCQQWLCAAHEVLTACHRRSPCQCDVALAQHSAPCLGERAAAVRVSPGRTWLLASRMAAAAQIAAQKSQQPWCPGSRGPCPG